MNGRARASNIRRGLIARVRRGDAVFNATKIDRAAIPAEFALVTPEELYQRFVTTGLDYKGQVASGISDIGWAVSVGLLGEFDFSSLLAGPVGSAIFGGITPKANVTPAYASTLLMVIQRLPSHVSFVNAAQTQAERSSASDFKVMSNHVIQFATMFGSTKSIQAEISMDLAVGRQKEEENYSLGKDTWSIEKGIAKSLGGDGFLQGNNTIVFGASIGARGTYKFQQMIVMDPRPGYYPSVSDKNLKRDFDTMLGADDKDALKIEIYQWICKLARGHEGQTVAADRRLTTNALKLAQARGKIKSITEETQAIAELGNQETLLHLIPYDERQTLIRTGSLSEADREKYKDVKKKLTTSWALTKKTLDGLHKVLEIVDAPVTIRNAVNAMKTFQRQGSSDALIQSLKELRKQLINDRRSARNRLDGRYVPIIDQQIEQINGYLERLDAVRTAELKDKRDRERENTKKLKTTFNQKIKGSEQGKLNFVAIVCSDKLISGSAGAIAVVPLFAQVLVVATGGAKLCLTGSKRWARSRAQSSVDSNDGKKLITTQDTEMNYSQIVLSGELGADFTAFHGNAQLAKSGSKTLYNAFNYTSVTAYWIHTDQALNAVTLGTGSGVSFGYSIPVKTLVRIAKGERSDKVRKVIKTVAAALAVTDDTLKRFLESSNIAWDNPDQYPSDLIVESCFSFPVGFTVNMEKDNSRVGRIKRNVVLTTLGNDIRVKSFIKNVRSQKSKGNVIAPDALRLRVRLLDWNNEQNDRFRLGLFTNALPFIRLAPIERAGQDGIVDVYTHFVDKPEYNQRNQSLEAYEQSVPPVALYHQ